MLKSGNRKTKKFKISKSNGNRKKESKKNSFEKDRSKRKEPRQENPRSLLTPSLSLAREGWICTKEEEKKNGIIVSAVETRPAGRESSKVSPRIATRVYGVSVSRLGHACRVGVKRGTRRHARVFSLPPASDPAPDFQPLNLPSSLYVTPSFILIFLLPHRHFVNLYKFKINQRNRAYLNLNNPLREM